MNTSNSTTERRTEMTSRQPQQPQRRVLNGKPPTARWRATERRWEARKMVAGAEHSEFSRTGVEGPPPNLVKGDPLPPGAQEAINNWLAWFYGPQEPQRPTQVNYPTVSVPSAALGRPPETFDELVPLCLADVKVSHARRTFETYSDQWRLYLFPPFKDKAGNTDVRRLGLSGVRFVDVNRLTLKAYFDRMTASNMASTSIPRIKTALSKALKYAVENEWLDETPLRNIKTPTPRPRVGSMEERDVEPEPFWIPSVEQVNAFLEANKNDPNYSMWYTGFTLAARPRGTRSHGQRLPDPRSVWHVRADRSPAPRVPKTGARSGLGGHPPKYNSSRKLFAMAETVNVLMDQVNRSREIEAKHPEWNTPELKRWEGLLWRNRKGAAIEPGNLNGRFHIACKRAGWPGPRLHDEALRTQCLA